MIRHDMCRSKKIHRILESDGFSVKNVCSYGFSKIYLTAHGCQMESRITQMRILILNVSFFLERCLLR